MARNEAYNYFLKELVNRMPGMYETEDIPMEEKVLQVKYFTPDSHFTWFGAEYDPVTMEYFGYVIGFEREWGYFSLKELMEIRGPLGFPIERDILFKPIKFKELIG